MVFITNDAVHVSGVLRPSSGAYELYNAAYGKGMWAIYLLVATNFLLVTYNANTIKIRSFLVMVTRSRSHECERDLVTFSRKLCIFIVFALYVTNKKFVATNTYIEHIPLP
jgi:hypothetical protein